MPFAKRFVFLGFVCLLSLGSSSFAGPQTPHPSGHLKLADPIEALESHYEYLVIGSGYGASVAALRISEALHEKGIIENKLAIFERGKEWMPGDFPKDALELAQSVRSSLNPLGLINNDSSEFSGDMDVIGANALGGTSQLNAAITLRPPNNVWEQPEWPLEIRQDFASGKLEESFQRAESMLMPNLGLVTLQTKKSQAHVKNFPKGFPTGELTLNVNHDPNHHRFGVRQNACTSCGNCCGGCNVGAKNVLTTNYLPASKKCGAEIFTKIEVTHIEKLSATESNELNAKWRVFFKYHGDEEIKFESVTTNNIFIGAGSAGSTGILLRSAQNGLALSKALGSRVSANGDVLGFVYNSKVQTNIAAYKDNQSLIQQANSVGQTITVYGDYREFNKNEPLEKQFVLLDGAVPSSMAAELKQILATTMGFRYFLSASKLKRVGRDLIPGYPSKNGAFNHSMLLLACGHDSSCGRYVLDSEQNVYVKWPNVQEEASFQYINHEMEVYAKRMGGTFIENPRASFLAGGKMQATHPLGGSPMGASIESGVVNHLGQVYNPAGGIYEGLHVLDASIIPRSLAAPPLITITAIAERALKHFVDTTMSACDVLLNPKE